MARKICHIDFEDDRYVDIELIDNPLVEMWIENHKNNAELTNKKYAAFMGMLLDHAAVGKIDPSDDFFLNRRKQSVNNINKAIISLKEEFDLDFPFKAFNDMNWINTNKIHRCFTSAEISLCNWTFRNNYNKSDLLKFKYLEKHPSEYFTEIHELFRIEEYDKTKFINLIEDINCWVHIYENSKFSEFADLMIKSLKDRKDIYNLDIDFDTQNEHGSSYIENISMPLEYQKFCVYDSDEYDVYFLKSITGKDYAQALQELDNPIEWDISNMGHITGGLKIFPSKLYAKIWQMDIPKNWLKIHDMPCDIKLIQPPVLGKVLNKDWYNKFNRIDWHPTKKNNSGLRKVVNEYGMPKNIEIG